MPTIPISQMPDVELVRLINAASAELARRMGAELPAKTPAAVRSLSRQELALPDDGQQDFVLCIKAKLVAGGYVTADERRRVAEIAQKHGSWVRRQGLPTEHNTGPWRKAAEYLSRRRSAAR